MSPTPIFGCNQRIKAFRVVEDCLKELKSKNFEGVPRGEPNTLAANCLSLEIGLLARSSRAHIWSHGLVGDPAEASRTMDFF